LVFTLEWYTLWKFSLCMMIEARQKEKYFKSMFLLFGFMLYVNIWRLEVWIVMCYTRDTSEIQSVWKKHKCITQLLLYFYPSTVESRCSQRHAHSGTAFTLWSKVLECALETESKRIKTTLSVGLEFMSFVLLLLLLQHIGLCLLSASNKHVISETGSCLCPPWCWLLY